MAAHVIHEGIFVAMSSLDRMLDVLRLFSEGEPIWTIDQATARLGPSRSTVYRYFRVLTKAGLLVPVAGRAYALGPWIVELDRQIRLSDPLLRAAQPVMADLQEQFGEIILLCRLFHTGVLCIHQEGSPTDFEVSFSRGRVMPMFRGASTQVLISHLPTRRLKDIFLHSPVAIAAASLGDDWQGFKAKLQTIRRAGYRVSERGEVDPGVFGIGVPIFDSENAILASLTVVLPEHRHAPGCEREFVDKARAAAARVTDSVTLLEESLADTEDAAFDLAARSPSG